MNELVILEQYNFMMGLDLGRLWTSLLYASCVLDYRILLVIIVYCTWSEWDTLCSVILDFSSIKINIYDIEKW